MSITIYLPYTLFHLHTFPPLQSLLCWPCPWVLSFFFFSFSQSFHPPSTTLPYQSCLSALYLQVCLHFPFKKQLPVLSFVCFHLFLLPPRGLLFPLSVRNSIKGFANLNLKWQKKKKESQFSLLFVSRFFTLTFSSSYSTLYPTYPQSYLYYMPAWII